MTSVITYLGPNLRTDYDALWIYLRKIFEERIVVLDGGMGTQIQKYKLQEEDYRGTLALSLTIARACR